MEIPTSKPKRQTYINRGSLGKSKLSAMLTRLSQLLAAMLFISVAMSIMANAQPGGHTEVEIVTLTYNGFSPRAITRRPGPFILSLNNSTRVRALEFSVEDDRRNLVQPAVTLGDGTVHGHHSTLNLAPGTYVVKVRQLPAHTMSIVISAR